MENIPNYVPGTFIAIVIVVLAFLAFAINVSHSGKKKKTTYIALSILIMWISIISILSTNLFFLEFAPPPRLFFFVGLSVIAIALLFALPKTRKFLGDIPITTLHYLHIVRVPVEMVLWWLGVWFMVPMEMTFEGANLDIVSGISAPFAAVFLVGNGNKNRIGAIVWNFIALGLLIHIVALAISYAPYFYDETLGGIPANKGIFYFPYVLLPTFVVPVVLFCHVVALYQLLFKRNQSQF